MVRLFSFCALVVALAAAGCGKSDDLPVTPTIGTIATLQGTVLTPGPNGYLSLPGVSISVQGVSLMSERDGTYAASGFKPGNAILRAERSGFHAFVGQVILEGAVTYNFVLLPLSTNGGG